MEFKLNGTGNARESECLKNTSFLQAQFATRNNRFTRSSRNSPCPICGRTKDTDCSWKDSVILCHSYIDHDACISGYLYQGSTNCGTWGVYFPKSAIETKSVRPRGEKKFFYLDASGQPLVRVSRSDSGDGKKKFFQSHWDGTKWISKVPDEVKSKLHLYRMADPINRDAISNGKFVLIVEGEGKVDLLLSMGMAATCCIGGAGKWRKYGYPNYLEDLSGAKVVLCPDRDEVGLRHCLDINQDFPDAQWLYAFPNSPVWKNLPEKHGVDIADWIADYRLSAEQVLASIGNQQEFAEPDLQYNQVGKQSNIDRLIAIASEANYFHTPDGIPYADLFVNDHRETVRLYSEVFKSWLNHKFYIHYQKVASSEAFNSCLCVLEGLAKFEAEAQEVYFRIAEHRGKIYLDLGTPDWVIVEISAEGWQIVRDCPVKFRRSPSMLPLPLPQREGNIAELEQVLNCRSSDQILILSWLLFCFYPNFPHPILILSGEQGSGKSGVSRLLKSLIDPGKAPLLPEPRELRDLAISANNRWLLCFDNFSGISNRLSDILCRVATGAGFSTRTLHKNDEETFFEFTRPILINGIDDIATRSDLLERSILVTLPAIPEENRLTEEELEAKIETIRPRVLGALLTAVSKTLRALPDVETTVLPRMADFARWAIAAEAALGSEAGSFLRTYNQNRQLTHEIALEASPVAIAIQRLMQSRQTWQGSATELLAELEMLVDDRLLKSRTWIKSPRSLGKALRRIAADLRVFGIEIDLYKGSGGQRLILLENQDLQMPQTP